MINIIKLPAFSEKLLGETVPVELTQQLPLYINQVWSNHVNSEEYCNYSVCEAYFKTENKKVDDKKRLVYTRSESGEPVLTESCTLSNNKIYHALYKKLVTQKTGYVFSKLFKLKAKNREDDKFEDMRRDVNSYLNEDLHRTLKPVLDSSVSKGIGWVHAFWDESGNLSFARVPVEQVKPIWSDAAKTKLAGLIHCYVVRSWSDGAFNDKTRYDYYTADYVVRYESDGAKVYPAPGERFIEPYIIVDNTPVDLDVTETVLEPPVLGRIPWICFRYQDDFESLLERVKSLIDAIDMATSQIADDIEDTPNSVMMFKNISTNDNQEFLHNLNEYRYAIVGGEGDAKVLNNPIDIANTINYIEHLSTKLYESAAGIDTASKDSRDTSSTALKILFGDLDSDAKQWEIELRASILELMWFILYDVKLKTGKDYFDVDYSILFTHDIIVNETEMIQNILTTTGITSNETNLQYHPFVEDVQYELDRLEKEQHDKMELELEYAEKESTFGTDVNLDQSANLEGVRGAKVE